MFQNNVINPQSAQVTVAESDALLGTSGTPSSSNKFVTNADPRINDSASAILTHYASVALTANEIKALRATAKTLLASPGANVWAEVVSFVLFLKFGTIAFTGIGTCQLKYNTSAGPTILDTALPAAAFVIGASAITQVSAFNQTFV